MNCWVPDTKTLELEGVIEIGPGATKATLALEVVDGLDCSEAVTVIPMTPLTTFGAVYIPEPSMVPTEELPPATPFTDHETERPAGTVNCCAAATETVAEAGVTDKVGAGGGGGVVTCVPPPPQDRKLPLASRTRQMRFDLSVMGRSASQDPVGPDMGRRIVLWFPFPTLS